MNDNYEDLLFWGEVKKETKLELILFVHKLLQNSYNHFLPVFNSIL